MHWKPLFGAWLEGETAHFRVWAPDWETVEVVLLHSANRREYYPLRQEPDGCFAGSVPRVVAGTRYLYRLDGGDEFPDPASRFQPEGVHGPSAIIDAAGYAWGDAGWKGIPYDDLTIYEVHVGTFSPAGTFDGVTERLPYLQNLGVTAIELMPVADFPGERNWGYDGVALYAPARCYGRPDDLRRLVEAAHRHGLAVILDVVYNHLGPDGNYLAAFSPYLFSTKHESPWGAALNFDGRQSGPLRSLLIDNALYWLHDFHFDGLRLDATHAIRDDSATHFIAELASRVRAAFPQRRVHLIAEDHRNLADMIRPAAVGGWGLDGVWADDFHHEVRRMLAGDHEGYYRDYSGTVDDIATTVRQGWFFTGQWSQHLREPRGTDPAGLSPRAFVICLQNHDQVGNRALGERLHHQVDLAAYRAVTALLLCAPQTPLLFMGQEWAATNPFLFFTDHNRELGRRVTEGRREEFRHFSAFTDPQYREKVPDPQAESSFLASKLRWEELDRWPHTGIHKLYQTLLRLRKTDPALASARRDGHQCFAPSDGAVVLQRRAADGHSVLLVCQLRGGGKVDLTGQEELEPWAMTWEVVLTTEDAAFTNAPRQPEIDLSGPAPWLRFAAPAAVLLRGTQRAGAHSSEPRTKKAPR